MASKLAPNRSLVLIPSTTLAAAGTYTGEEIALPLGVTSLALEAIFVRVGGGTTTDVYVQTSLDAGTTWIDIAEFAFTTTTASKLSAVKADTAVTPGSTPTDGSLSANTVLDGFFGDRVRAKYVVVGTYTGASSIKVVAVAN